jgi:Flp pilus assembly protein TadB
MAQTKRKRNRKHRGTQAGTIEARGRTGRPQTATEAKQIRRDRRDERINKPPSWRSSLNRAAISAVVFGVFTMLAFGWSVAQALPLTIAMVLFYLPLSYVTDRFIYNRRQRQRAARGGR